MAFDGGLAGVTLLIAFQGPPDGPSFWDWFQYGCVGSIYFWWLALIVVSTASYPLVRRFRTWQAKRRFIESQGALLQNPQNAEVRFQLANIYAEGGRWRRAAEYAQEAVRIAQENPLYEGKVPYHFLRLLGDAMYHLKRYDRAVEAFERALQAKSDLGHEEARFGLAKSLFRRGELEKALEGYRKVTAENGSNLEAYFRVAQAAAKLGKEGEVEGARTEFRRVAAALPRFARQRRFRWRVAFLLFPLTRFFV